MTPLIIIVVLLAIAAVGAWGLSRRNRARKLTQQRVRAESERLATQTRLAHEKAMADAKARDDACQQAEAEQRSRKETEARENARLAEERRLAAEKLAAEAEAKRRTEEKALTDAQVREAARLKGEVEAKQRADAEERENLRLAAEEEQRAEERRQAEETERVQAEARDRARIVAEKKARRDVEKVETEDPPGEPAIEAPSRPKTAELDETPRPPTYRPTRPSATTPPSRPRRPTGSRTAQTSNADLRLRVQLVFGRGGVVRNLALAPDRRDGMPSEVEVTGTQGELHLTELREECYEPVTLSDAGNALTQGIEWRGRGDARQWRWVLGGRELYVLASGDVAGLYPYGSSARLILNAKHVVLATRRLRDEVLAALAEAGCGTPEISDDTVSGVPAGWLLFRDVIPTRAVPMRDERDILDALCPAHEIEPHFVGGIRLERNTWLAGFPPRIRFTGQFANGFQVKIDGHPAQPTSDGAFEAPGWDSEGEHRLWFGDRAETYSVCTMDEAWEHWPAHDFGIGAAICGASTHRLDGAHWRQVCVPASNPLLIGARPGEIFRCPVRNGLNTGRIIALVPFAPVWALPMDRLSKKNCSIRLVLLEFIEPTKALEQNLRKRKNGSAFRQWAFSIRNARRKQLTPAVGSEETMSLWRRYGVAAKHLWRQLR